MRGGFSIPWVPSSGLRVARLIPPAPKTAMLAPAGTCPTFSTEHSPVVAEADPEAKETLSRALELLAPEFREIIILRELQGLSYKEISDVAGVPVGTVMSRLSRARAHLQRALRKED